MSQLPSINPLDPVAQRSVTNGFRSLSSEDFVRIIFTELSNQDPFAPTDSAALLEQLNSIRAIESDLELMEKLDALVFENQLASAANLIGREVEGLTPQLGRVSGVVTSVRREGDEILLELDGGWRMKLSEVERIDAPTQPASPPPPDQTP